MKMRDFHRLFPALLLTVSLSAAAAPKLAEAPSFTFEDCYARLENGRLTIGNARLERVWRVQDGLLYPVSFRTLGQGGAEWMGVPPRLPAPYPPAGLPEETRHVRLLGAGGTFGATEAASLRVELESAGATATTRYEFQVFPHVAGVRMWMVASQPAAGAAPGAPSAKSPFPREDALDHLLLTNPHVRLTRVALFDRSDHHNELAQETEWLLHPNETLIETTGNLFFIENTLTGSGLAFLKEGALPEDRPAPVAADLRVDGSGMMVSDNPSERANHVPAYQFSFYGHGTAAGQGDPFVLLAYQGGRTGRIAALHNYQRQLRQYDAARDGRFVSNTWGDWSQGKRISDAFIRKEIDAAARLGLDTVQIDAGWESGGHPPAGYGPWDPSPARFPQGLAPVIDYARSKKLAVSLWYQPDWDHEFAGWQKEADQLLRLYRTYPISGFKVDGVMLTSRESQQRFRQLLDRELEETGGRMAINVDITAQSRLGYFGAIQAGSLFVENRYTDTHRYWPHQSLRNLWKLAQYVDPVRLQIEFLNSERNQTLYHDDPLAPARYQPDYLFATTMFGSPLAFLESSGLSDGFIARMAPLVRTWKQHREAIYRGVTVPVGAAPDGFSWTGFASLAEDGRSGYLLVFREMNESATWTLPPGLFHGAGYTLERLGGNGSARESNGAFVFEVPDRPGFVWFRVTARH